MHIFKRYIFRFAVSPPLSSFLISPPLSVSFYTPNNFLACLSGELRWLWFFIFSNCLFSVLKVVPIRLVLLFYTSFSKISSFDLIKAFSLSLPRSQFFHYRLLSESRADTYLCIHFLSSLRPRYNGTA